MSFSNAELQARHRAGLRSDIREIKQAVIGQQDRAADDLVNILSVQVRAAALGQYVGETASAMFPGNRFVQRAASSDYSTSTAPDVLGFSLADSLVGLVPPGGAFRGLIDHGTQIDLSGIAKVYIPKVQLSAADAGNWVSEGVANSNRVLAFGLGSSLEPKKVVVSFSFTREMAEHSSITSIMRRVLGEVVPLVIDTEIFSNNAASASKPAGMLQTGAISPTANGGLPALAQDASNMVGALVSAGGGADPIFFCNPATAVRLRALWFAFPYPLYTSSVLSDDLLVCSEGSAFVAGFVNNGLPEIRISTETTIVNMDDDPTPDIASGGVLANSVRSLWQADLISMKMTARVGWCTRSAALVQQVASVTW